MRYHVAKDKDLADLTGKVNRLLDEGWELHGGMSHIKGSGYKEYEYHQPMIYKEN